MTLSTRSLAFGALFALFLLGGQLAFAASSTSSANSITPTSGDDVKEGDDIYFTTYSGLFTQVVPAGATAPATVKYYCAPPKTHFVVDSIVPASTSGTGTTDSPQAANSTIVRGHFPSGGPISNGGLHFENKIPADTSNASHPGCESTAGWVALDSPYQFTSGNFNTVGSQRLGFTWGAMVIPYKYYFTDHSIQGTPSTVAYVGYEGWFPGVSLAGVVSAGLGVAQTASNASNSPSGSNSGTTSSSSNSTSANAIYTWGVGFVATFGKSIQAGVMTGRDYQATGSGFKYQNKQWIALSVGTSF